MKILYVTDLHGIKGFYNQALDIALKEKVDMVINGGDMMPNGSETHDIFTEQQKFIEEFLINHWKKYEKNKIYHLGMLGNDDLKIYDELFDKKCRVFKYIKNIAQKKVSINGYEFIGFNWVNDYPFQLKDRCRRDFEGFALEHQFGPGMLSTEKGYIEVFPTWKELIKTLPTMEDELNKLPQISNPDKTIFISHMPPNKVELDVCQDGRQVGSKSVYNYIEKSQPLISCHGHIHENFHRTKRWENKIGKTVCIQPGQMGETVMLYDYSIVNKLVYVIINTEPLEYRRFEEV